jgi:hypothetical protein
MARAKTARASTLLGDIVRSSSSDSVSQPTPIELRAIEPRAYDAPVDAFG